MPRCGFGGAEQWGREAPEQTRRDEGSGERLSVTITEEKEITSSHSLNTLSPSGLCQTRSCTVFFNSRDFECWCCGRPHLQGGNGESRGKLY